MCIKTLASGAIEGCNAIIIDDGIAYRTHGGPAIQAVCERNPDCIVIAVPVAPAPMLVRLLEVAYGVVVLSWADEFLGSAGACYSYFPQATDQEVASIFATDRLRATRH